jgi:hypothetical protein
MWLRRKLRQVGEGTLGRLATDGHLMPKRDNLKFQGGKTRAERLVIMPAAVWRRRKNL